MTNHTIDPENWVNREVEVEVNEEGNVFTIHGYRFRIKSRYYAELEEETVRVPNEDDADLVEYSVYSDDGSWDEDIPMAKGARWPSVYGHNRVIMYRDFGHFEREADTAWEAAAKVLGNTI